MDSHHRPEKSDEIDKTGGQEYGSTFSNRKQRQLSGRWSLAQNNKPEGGGEESDSAAPVSYTHLAIFRFFASCTNKSKVLRAIPLLRYSGTVYTVSYTHLDVYKRQDHIGKGQIFAETYACIGTEPLMINVQASEETTAAFFNIRRLLEGCCSSCSFRGRLVRNLLQVMAQKMCIRDRAKLLLKKV